MAYRHCVQVLQLHVRIVKVRASSEDQYCPVVELPVLWLQPLVGVDERLLPEFITYMVSSIGQHQIVVADHRNGHAFWYVPSADMLREAGVMCTNTIVCRLRLVDQHEELQE